MEGLVITKSQVKTALARKKNKMTEPYKIVIETCTLEQLDFGTVVF